MHPIFSISNADNFMQTNYWILEHYFKKKTYYILVFLILAVISIACNNLNETHKRIDLSNSILVDSNEVVYIFEDEYPVSLSIKDSLLYVIKIKSDYCMTIINLNTRKEIKSFGHKGYGPNDLIGPNFVLSTDNDAVIVDDGNLKRILQIKYATDNMQISDHIEYPNQIFISSEINISNNYIVGRKLDALEGKMFFVYNRNTENIIETEYCPKLSIRVLDSNYTYASTIGLNEQKNSIIAGMYFFDMFHVYDLKGNRINTFYFSEKSIPDVDKKNKTLDLSDGYSGVIRIFTTKEYCYLMRISTQASDTEPQMMIIQIDWDGKLINAYRFKDNISGQFYVDETNRKIYLIKNYINSVGNDIFAIVAYKVI